MQNNSLNKESIKAFFKRIGKSISDRQISLLINYFTKSSQGKNITKQDFFREFDRSKLTSELSSPVKIKKSQPPKEKKNNFLSAKKTCEFYRKQSKNYSIGKLFGKKL